MAKKRGKGRRSAVKFGIPISPSIPNIVKLSTQYYLNQVTKSHEWSHLQSHFGNIVVLPNPQRITEWIEIRRLCRDHLDADCAETTYVMGVSEVVDVCYLSPCQFCVLLIISQWKKIKTFLISTILIASAWLSQDHNNWGYFWWYGSIFCYWPFIMSSEVSKRFFVHNIQIEIETQMNCSMFAASRRIDGYMIWSN